MGMFDTVISNRVPFMKKALICCKVEIVYYGITQALVFLIIFNFKIPIFT